MEHTDSEDQDEAHDRLEFDDHEEVQDRLLYEDSEHTDSDE